MKTTQAKNILGGLAALLVCTASVAQVAPRAAATVPVEAALALAVSQAPQITMTPTVMTQIQGVQTVAQAEVILAQLGIANPGATLANIMASPALDPYAAKASVGIDFDMGGDIAGLSSNSLTATLSAKPCGLAALADAPSTNIQTERLAKGIEAQTVKVAYDTVGFVANGELLPNVLGLAYSGDVAVVSGLGALMPNFVKAMQAEKQNALTGKPANVVCALNTAAKQALAQNGVTGTEGSTQAAQLAAACGITFGQSQANMALAGTPSVETVLSVCGA